MLKMSAIIVDTGGQSTSTSPLIDGVIHRLECYHPLLSF